MANAIFRSIRHTTTKRKRENKIIPRTKENIKYNICMQIQLLILKKLIYTIFRKVNVLTFVNKKA